MEKYYFTFGSQSKCPYRNTYIIVVASSFGDAIDSFGKKFPDVPNGIASCSGCYTEEQWKEAKKPYADKEPAEIIWTETCFGKKIEGYEDLFIFVPEEKQIIQISEGAGDNLFQEDIDNGCVDYIYYEQFELDNGVSEVNGGMVLLEENFRDKYSCTADCIKDVLDMAYGNCLIDCMILA